MNNVTAIRQIAPQLDTESLATGYLFQVRWENRVTALHHCIRQLVANHDMTEAAAELAALQAYAAIEGTNQGARIDVDATTSDLVVLRTDTGCPVAFTTADLLRLLQRARHEGAAVVVDQDRQRPVVLEH
jgi:hypothetical protein